MRVSVFSLLIKIPYFKNTQEIDKKTKPLQMVKELFET
jgi:hypothetical protein